MSKLQPASPEPSLPAYVADLELEVDSVRSRLEFLRQAVLASASRIEPLCGPALDADSGRRIGAELNSLLEVVGDLREPFDTHPARDQAVAIAVRPLIEQTFRWQQRVLNAPFLGLRLELEDETVVWFPGRLRHILNILIAGAVKDRDPHKGEMRLTLSLQRAHNAYELQLSDNGCGSRSETNAAANPALHERSSPARSATLDVGLSVVRVLLEQSGGGLEVFSHEGEGACVRALLPRFDLNDFVE